MMKQSVAISILFHLLLVGGVVYGLPKSSRTLNVPPVAIPVEIVEIDDVRRQAQKPDEKPADEPEPVPQVEEQPVHLSAQPQAAPKASAQVAEAVPLPNAKPDKAEKPKPETDQKSEPSLSVSPRSKPTQKPTLDTQRLAALIDRSIKDTPAPKVDSRKDLEKKMEKAVDTPPKVDIATHQATAMLEDAIRQRVEKCWIVPAGAKSGDEMLIPIRMWLNTDGTLLRAPQLLDTSRMSNTFYRAAAESALRAVRMCAPYELPKDRYNLWREITLNFDPSDFIG